MSTDQIEIPHREPYSDTIRIPGQAPTPALTYGLAVQVLTGMDPSKGVDRGQLRAVRQRIPSGHQVGKAIDAWLAKPAAPPRPAPYRAPWARPGQRPAHLSPDGESTPLTPSEITWLQSLPAEPEKLSEPEAVRLAELAERYPTKLGKQSTDGMLVERAFAPVRAHHERLERCSELLQAANTTSELAAAGLGPAQRVPVDVFAQRAKEWAPILRDLVLDEVPDLTEREAEARVAEDLQARWIERANQSRQARDAAVAELSTAAMKRAAALLPVADSAA